MQHKNKQLFLVGITMLKYVSLTLAFQINQAYYEVSCILNLTLRQTQLIVGVCAFMYQSTAILQENFTHETERVR